MPHIEDPDTTKVAARSTTVLDYHRSARRDCELAGNSDEGHPICLPQWRFPLNYGYYCGKDRPVRGFLGNPILDPLDYCCRLHDQNLFADPVRAVHNACGFVMCVSQAEGFPADITERLPDVERARRQMYNKATILCGVEVQPELPAPEIVPP